MSEGGHFKDILHAATIEAFCNNGIPRAPCLISPRVKNSNEKTPTIDCQNTVCLPAGDVVRDPLPCCYFGPTSYG